MSDNSGEIVPQDPTGLHEGNENSRIMAPVALVWEAPLPPPILLEQYKQLVPRAPEIILDMAVKQSDHRMYMDRKSISISGWGLAVGSVITFLLALGGFFLVYIGRPVEGISLIVADMVGVSWVFIYGTRQRESRS